MTSVPPSTSVNLERTIEELLEYDIERIRALDKDPAELERWIAPALKAQEQILAMIPETERKKASTKLTQDPKVLATLTPEQQALMAKSQRLMDMFKNMKIK